MEFETFEFYHLITRLISDTCKQNCEDTIYKLYFKPVLSQLCINICMFHYHTVQGETVLTHLLQFFRTAKIQLSGLSKSGFLACYLEVIPKITEESLQCISSLIYATNVWMFYIMYKLML